MNSLDLLRIPVSHRRSGFTLVELLVVIAIMGILMSAGAIGLSGMTGKGVTSGAASAEGLFEEARTIAISQRTRTRVMIAKVLTNNGAENLRRIVVVSEALKADGTPDTNNWILTSRGTVLPDQTFFSQTFSKKDQVAGSGAIDEVASLTGAKANLAGSYFYYEFNSEGICSNPGTSFVIGYGVRSPTANTVQPKLTSSSKRDFGGFVIWSNGRTSAFRSPDQISTTIKSLASGSSF